MELHISRRDGVTNIDQVREGQEVSTPIGLDGHRHITYPSGIVRSQVGVPPPKYLLLQHLVGTQVQRHEQAGLYRIEAVAIISTDNYDRFLHIVNRMNPIVRCKYYVLDIHIAIFRVTTSSSSSNTGINSRLRDTLQGRGVEGRLQDERRHDRAIKDRGSGHEYYQDDEGIDLQCQVDGGLAITWTCP